MRASIKEGLQTASAELIPHSDTPALEAEILLMSVLEKPRSYLHAWPEKTLNNTEMEKYEQCINQRIAGEPIAHITGEKEFWSLPLRITPDVLIPRPETELLVEVALRYIPEHTRLEIADLGTGSGAIAIALASERPYCRITATDKSAKALELARQNARKLELENIRFIISDWCAELKDQTYDMIVSNPPYIAENDPHLNQGDLPREPRLALTSGADGLDDIRVIIDEARQSLKPGGRLIIEHGYDQEAAVKQLLASAGYINITCHYDPAGLPRVSTGTLQT